MKSNNLKQLEKDLKAFAKRVKNFKYTDSALITFLITGMILMPNNLFSATTDKNIEGQRQEISTSIKNMRQTLRKTRTENNKLLKDTNLELIQLMEQGDYVVKSPWSSWQYGINYFYNDWSGTYKGRGDKEDEYPYEGLYERSTNSFERYSSPLSPNYNKLLGSRNPYSASSNNRQGLPTTYGIASNNPAQEPIVEMNVEASIRPKTVAIEIPNLGIQAPILNALAVNGAEPRAVTVPRPTPPNISVETPEPNGDPFVDYCFTGCGASKYFRQGGGGTGDDGPARLAGGNAVYYAGVDTLGNLTNTSRPAQVIYINNSSNTNGHGYLYSNDTTTVTLNIAGSANRTTQNVGSGKQVAGQIGIHSVADGKLAHITGNLYGQAAFHSIETWHAGHNEYDDVKVNIKGIDNTVFLIYPAAWETLLLHTSAINGSHNKRGEFIGKVDVMIPETASKNIIYNVLGVQAAFAIKSEGEYILEGQGNMVYSGYGYSPNYQKLVGQTYTSTEGAARAITIKDTDGGSHTDSGTGGTGMTPYIDLSKYTKSYGDDNIILYFANKNENAAGDPYNEGINSGANSRDNWKKSIVGIYQGEIRAKAIIGSQLNNANSSSQTGGNKTGGDANYVETNVGIFSRSGQRSDISPTRDLKAISIFDNDPIKALQVNDIDIQFGKYSKSGIMIASEYGTQIDVAESSMMRKLLM